jgi:choline kinase
MVDLMSGKIKAIILAAGRGTRMGEYGADKPKGLIELAGRSLLQHQVDTLRHAGIMDIIVVTGYRYEQIQIAGVRTYHNPDYATTNMVESLMCASEELDGDVVVAYADIIYRADLVEKLVSANNGDVVLSVDANWRSYWQLRLGSTEVDLESLAVENGQVKELGRPLNSSDGLSYRYIGLLKFRGPVWGKVFDLYARKMKADENWIASGKSFRLGYMTDLLNELILGNISVVPCVTQSGWFEFDEASDYELAQSLIATGYLNSVPVQNLAK